MDTDWIIHQPNKLVWGSVNELSPKSTCLTAVTQQLMTIHRGDLLYFFFSRITYCTWWEQWNKSIICTILWRWRIKFQLCRMYLLLFTIHCTDAWRDFSVVFMSVHVDCKTHGAQVQKDFKVGLIVLYLNFAIANINY